MEYPRTSHVLASPDNVALLEQAVRGMVAAEGLGFSALEVTHAVAAQVQSAIEHNITGARYLTHASILTAANEYIAIHALQDLRHAFSMVNATASRVPATHASGPAAASHARTDSDTVIRTTRRREVGMRDAASAWPALPPAPQQLREPARTPRALLR